MLSIIEKGLNASHNQNALKSLIFVISLSDKFFRLIKPIRFNGEYIDIFYVDDGVEIILLRVLFDGDIF